MSKGMRPGDTVLVYADGSSLGNPGPSGWAYLIHDLPKNDVVALSGGEALSTNNAMEITAALMALDRLPVAAVGALRTDSKYVVNGVNSWRKGWEARGMKTAGKAPVKNADLWRALYAHVDTHPHIRIEWVKGHAADPSNLVVDELAKEAARGFK